MRFQFSSFIITLTRLAILSWIVFAFSPARSDPALSAASLPPEIATALDKNSLYIAPALRGETNERAVANILRRTPTATNVLLMAQLPPGVKSPEQLAAAVQEYCHPADDGLIIIVTERPRRIVAYGAGLDQQALQQIVAAPTKTFDAEGYAAGIAQIVRLVEQERETRRVARSRTIFLGCGAAAVLAILLLRCRKRNAV